MTTAVPIFNPFPGLRPFDYAQHHLFFGREEQVRQLLNTLEEHRFLVVLGPSGCGKSSLVRAGMVPQLRAGQVAQGDWKVAICSPGRSAMGSLAATLNAVGIGGDGAEARLHQDTSGLAEVAKSAGITAGHPLLLVVDQFEEIFRLHPADDAAAAEAELFVDSVLVASRQREIPIYVALTMRAEFLGDCTIFPGLPEAINDVDYLVPRMNREQLQATIEKPIGVAGAEIVPDLVERVLEDSGESMAQLPLMQHALMRTWDYWQAHGRERRPLQMRHYEAIGTMSEAFSRHAEEVYAELPDDDARRIASVVFKSMGSDSEDVSQGRRSATVDEIGAVAGVDSELAMAVIEHFRGPGRCFFTPLPEVPLTDEVVLDMAHEDLMRRWRRSQEWIEEERRSTQLYMRLASTAALYQEGRSGLYQDPDLQLALDWRRQSQPTAAWGQRYDLSFERAVTFLEHSRKERDFLLARREESRRRQLKRTRIIAALAGGASLVFLFFLIFALNLYVVAEESKEVALEQKQVAEQERLNADKQREIALEQKQVAEQERLNADTQRQIALEQKQVAEQERLNADTQREVALEQKQVAEQERLNADTQREIALEQKQVAEQERFNTEEQRQIALEQKRHAERLRLLSVARSLAIQATKIQQRGEQAQLGALLALQAYSFNDRYGGSSLDSDIYNALRFALQAFEGQPVLRGHADAVRALAFSSDGRILASGSDDGDVRLWDMGPGKYSSRVLHHREDRMRSLTFSPRGELAGGSVGGSVWVWWLADAGRGPERLAALSSTVSSLIFDSRGEYLAAATLNGHLGLWNRAEGTEVSLVAPRSGGRLYAAVFCPGEGLLAVGGEQEKVRLWKMEDRYQPLAELETDGVGVRSLACSADGRWLAAGRENGDVLIWDTRRLTEDPNVLLGHHSGVTALNFHPDNRLLVSGSLDRTLRIWGVQQPDEEPILIEGDDWIWTVAFSPDGEQLACGGAERNIHLWTTHASRLAARLQTRIERNMTPKEWQRFVGADIPYEKTRSDLPEQPIK